MLLFRLPQLLVLHLRTYLSSHATMLLLPASLAPEGADCHRASVELIVCDSRRTCWPHSSCAGLNQALSLLLELHYPIAPAALSAPAAGSRHATVPHGATSPNNARLSAAPRPQSQSCAALYFRVGRVDTPRASRGYTRSSLVFFGTLLPFPSFFLNLRNLWILHLIQRSGFSG